MFRHVPHETTRNIVVGLPCVAHVKRTSTRRHARLQDDENKNTRCGVGGEMHGFPTSQKRDEEREEGH